MSNVSNRLLSLDVMRGLIMILLAADSALVYAHIRGLTTENSIAEAIISQFTHHEWHGLLFWDLVQPAFMFMAGSALYISYKNKLAKGISWRQNLKHILSRCFKLFVCGVALHCVYAGQLVWELWNVLVQLALTTIIAYMIINRSMLWQLMFSIFLLVLTEVLYRYTNVQGFDQPFVITKNFGAYVDLLLMNKINDGGWATINFIPTAAHTIWGCIAGRFITSGFSNNKILRTLILAGVVMLLVGYAMDFTITPIIKRISTSSFVVVSGGYVVLLLALLYFIYDVKKYNKHAWIFTVVGMNAIFLYLFFETVSRQWLNRTMSVFVESSLSLIGIGEQWTGLLSSLCTLGFLWYLCYWLYTKKIFFKL